MTLTVDVAFGHALVVCTECNWRSTQSTRADAWTAGAEHLKRDHRDMLAARHASDAARKARLRIRPQSPDTGSHGTTRPPAHSRKSPAGSGPRNRAN